MNLDVNTMSDQELRVTIRALIETSVIEHDRITALQDRVLQLEMQINFLIKDTKP